MNEKQKLVLIKDNESVLVIGNHTDGAILLSLKNNHISGIIYDEEWEWSDILDDVRAKENHGDVLLVRFDNKIYLKAEKDKQNTAPIRISEKDNKLEFADIKKGRKNYICVLDNLMDYNPCLQDDNYMELVKGEPLFKYNFSL